MNPGASVTCSHWDLDDAGTGAQLIAEWSVSFDTGIFAAATLIMLMHAADAAAGPPYVTDDPEPVEHRHWELYLASQTAEARAGWSATAPHVEVNYGAVPDLQLHTIAPLSLAVPEHGPTQYGYGDTELGAKYRFVHESDYVPQIGTFPLAELPTGSRSRGLGNGVTQLCLPLWLQKSFGAWTTYGGAGYWIHPGAGNRNWVFFGWQLQRRLLDALTLGVEIFHLTPQVERGPAETRFNVGAVIDFTELHHLLLSAGRGLAGPSLFQGYIAYQLTFGPKQ